MNLVTQLQFVMHHAPGLSRAAYRSMAGGRVKMQGHEGVYVPHPQIQPCLRAFNYQLQTSSSEHDDPPTHILNRMTITKHMHPALRWGLAHKCICLSMSVSWYNLLPGEGSHVKRDELGCVASSICVAFLVGQPSPMDVHDAAVGGAGMATASPGMGTAIQKRFQNTPTCCG